MESPHLTLGQQAKVAAGIELVEQGKAELMTICRFIAWRIDSALQRRTNMFERRLQLQAGFSIQRLLILRINPFAALLKSYSRRWIINFLAAPPVEIGKIILIPPRLHDLTAEQRQA